MPRPCHDLADCWSFQRGSPRSQRADAETVDLPHCWNLTDTFQRGVEYYRGTGTYERRFETPPAPAPAGGWFLCSEGFYGLARVRLNGHRVGRFDGQYLGFEASVEDLLRPAGTNTLRIELTNRCPDYVLPGTARPDFLLFGGLAGRLRLEWRARSCFDLATLRLSGEEVLEAPRVVVRCALAGRAEAGLTAGWEVRDDSGTVLAARESPLLGGVAEARLEVPGARLWSPASPIRYALHGYLRRGDQVLDLVERRFGLRRAEFTPHGFLLNGERCELRGFNRHECLPGLGNALPAALHREDATTIRDLGGNFVRLSHYPQSPHFLDACDELGLLVYAEIASWKSVRGGRWLRRARRQMEAMIRRDRHHPSIVLWGMGNESQHRIAFEALHRVIRRLDPERASTYAENHLYRALRARTSGLPDVWGCNYEVDRLEELRRHCRTGCVVVSEACNEQAERGDVEAERGQVEAIEELWRHLDGKPWVAGYALWALNDYPTMFRDRFVRFTGKLDAWRLPKPAALLFAARHVERPFLQWAGAWGGVAVGTLLRLDLYGNCSEVTVSVGGRRVLTVGPGLRHAVEIPYEPFALRAVGRHPAGEAMCELEPFGSPAALVLQAAALGSGADGWCDLRLGVVDAAGRTVGDWRGTASVDAIGPVTIYPLSAAGAVPLAAGRGRAFARRLAAGPVELRGTAADLATARLTLPALPPAGLGRRRAAEPYNRALP